MAITSKLTSNGVYYTVGTIDEVTFNPNSGVTKNLLPYSEDLSQTSVWSYSNNSPGSIPVLLPNTIISPDRVTTANIVYFSSLNGGGSTIGNGGLYNPVVGETRTFSVWMKCINDDTYGNYTYVTLYNGDAINGSGLLVTNEWQRFVFNNKITASNAYGVRISKRNIWGTNGNAAIAIWGAQWEQANTATIYEATGANAIPLFKNGSRLDSNGNVYITGTIDEATFNPNSGYKKNLIINSQWIGGVSGNTQSGALPPTDNTGIGHWYLSTPGNIIYAPAASGTGYSCRFIGYSQRPYLTQYNTFNINPNTYFTFSVTVESLNLPFRVAGLFDVVGGSYTFTRSYYLNGVLVTDSIYTTPIVPGRYSVVLSTTSFVPIQSVLFRMGVGVDNTDTGDIVISNPQIELGNTATIYQPTDSFTNVVQQNFAHRLDNQGSDYVTNSYDEWTGFNAVTNGLVTYLDAAIPTSWPGSGTTWYDLSGNGLNAIPIYYAPTLPYFDTSSYSFAYTAGPQTQKSIVLPNVAALKTPSFSYETWVKQRAYNINDQYWNQLFGGEQYLTNGFRCGVTGAGYVVFWTNQSGGNFSLTSSVATTLNTFYHLVVTYDATTLTANMYINGVNVGTVTNAIYFVPTSSSQLGLGSGVGGTYDQIGNIAVFKAYNRAITPQEASDNFKATRNRFGV